MSKKKSALKNKKREKKKIALFGILLIVLLCSIIFFALKIYSSFSILEIQKIKFTLNVTDYVGLNVDTDKLHFGGVIPGFSSQRKILLTSDIEGFLFIKAEGSDWIYVEEQAIKIGPDSYMNINLKITVPKTAEYQNLEGTIYFYVMKTDNEFLLNFQKGKLLKTKMPTEQSSSKVSVNITE